MSRTTNSIRNSQIGLLFYFLEMLIGFWSRKVFIDYLGTEILGLNTTAMNLLQFLNLAELGIVSAITFTLYKPIANKDKQAINEIISVQGWLYRRIGCFVGGAALVLMCFFPIIFKKVDLPMWYVYVSFLAFLYSSLLTYFFNYKQIILSASQQEYKITISYKSIHVIKSLLQIFAISHFNNPYEWWLILQFTMSTIASININRVIKQSFPDLEISIKAGKKLKEKYSIIITKVKQLFFHKIAGFVLSQTSTLIIYSFTTLSMVGIYGNYTIIINSLTMMFNTAFNGINASIGHLISVDNTKTLNVFKELFTLRFLCISTIIFCLYRLLNPFIIVWVGSEYLLSTKTIYVILGTAYIMMMRGLVDSFISAYGLFKDIYAPIIEAVLNLTLSITLGYFYGITGVLLGVFISLICVVFIWKPYFLFKHGIQCNGMFYIKIYMTHILIFVASAFISIHLLDLIFPHTIDSYTTFAIQAISTFSTMLLIEFAMLYVCTDSIKKISKRILILINKKVRKK